MTEKIRDLANRQISPTGEASSFTQYLSLRFYRQKLDELESMGKDSVNVFLKTIAEIEEEFAFMLQEPSWTAPDLARLESPATVPYMEENY